MSIQIQPLPTDHPLSAAGAALGALEDWRLVVHAHQFVIVISDDIIGMLWACDED